MQQAFPFRMADGRPGETVAGELRFRLLNAPSEAVFEVDVNGFGIPADSISPGRRRPGARPARGLGELRPGWVPPAGRQRIGHHVAERSTAGPYRPTHGGA